MAVISKVEQRQLVHIQSALRVVENLIKSVKKKFGHVNALLTPAQLKIHQLDAPSRAFLDKNEENNLTTGSEVIINIIDALCDDIRYLDCREALIEAKILLQELKEYYTYLDKNNGRIPTEGKAVGFFKGLFSRGYKRVDHLLKFNNKSLTKPFEDVRFKLSFCVAKLSAPVSG